MRGIKLKLCISVHSISLHKTFVAVAHVLWLLLQLKFPLIYNGKSENWQLMLSLLNISFFIKTSELERQNLQIKKKKNPTPQKLYRGAGVDIA